MPTVTFFLGTEMCQKLSGYVPARFLKPWEVPDDDIHGMGQRSDAGNKYFLAVVDVAPKVAFTCPLPTQLARGVAGMLLSFMVSFRIPMSLRGNRGTKFITETIVHLCS